MGDSSFKAIKEVPKRGPFVELPAKAKFQEIRSGVGVIIPRGLLRYYGIINTESVSVEISPAEGGYYLKLVHQEGAFG